MPTFMRTVLAWLCTTLAISGLAAAQAGGPSPTTAWQQGQFHVDVAGVLGRSAIVLGQPNLRADQALPLGNGRLGVALWSANGLTAQLNRADTLPYRFSSGQVVIPGLSVLTSAKDFSGRLDLYNGDFREQGGGMTATAYVQPATDTLIVDVTGADPQTLQTARLLLWAPRTPQANVLGRVGVLSQTWADRGDPGASGRTFGALAAITAQGRDVSVVAENPLSFTVSFRPFADGHFRIFVAAPHYNDREMLHSVVAHAWRDTSPGVHRLWWNAFWNRAGVIKVTSPDGAGEYMENLRNIDLFTAAADSGGEYPGSHAGVADLFSSVRDAHRWDPAAFWHWNLRMQVAANLGAGVPQLNAPYFNLYRENLANIERWTGKHMSGRPGICVPETMRFNGQGIEYQARPAPLAPSTGLNCDADSKPYYNARTLSTGAEVSLWIWQQFLATNDRGFLARNYPVMAASARFLLAYEKQGGDGLLHTSPSNAHETQWDTQDPTTDIAARLALFPATIQAAQLLGRDAELVRQLRAALPRIPQFPLTSATGPKTLFTLPAVAQTGDTVIAESYDPAAKTYNVENIGLEPVWPYNLIGDDSPLFALAQRTYTHRPYPTKEDWSFDPLQAARLGFGGEVGATLIKLTETYQQFINGFANWGGNLGEFYSEQDGVVAAALQEALVQDYDGVIRIAPAIPPGWDFEGSVSVRGRTKVDVQVKDGSATTVAIEAGTTQQLNIRNPWPGQWVKIASGDSGRLVTQNATGPVITFHAVAGTRYLVERVNTPTTALSFAPVSGNPAHMAKKLGPVQIGLFAPTQ